jgi:hypothetical protein
LHVPLGIDQGYTSKKHNDRYILSHHNRCRFVHGQKLNLGLEHVRAEEMSQVKFIHISLLCAMDMDFEQSEVYLTTYQNVSCFNRKQEPLSEGQETHALQAKECHSKGSHSSLR